MDDETRQGGPEERADPRDGIDGRPGKEVDPEKAAMVGAPPGTRVGAREAALNETHDWMADQRRAYDAIGEQMAPSIEEPGSVAGPDMTLWEISVSPQMSEEVDAVGAPFRTFDIVAVSSKDAADEAVRRWREELRPSVGITFRKPILVERMGKGLTITHDPPKMSWWRRIWR